MGNGEWGIRNNKWRMAEFRMPVGATTTTTAELVRLGMKNPSPTIGFERERSISIRDEEEEASFSSLYLLHSLVNATSSSETLESGYVRRAVS